MKKTGFKSEAMEIFKRFNLEHDFPAVLGKSLWEKMKILLLGSKMDEERIVGKLMKWSRCKSNDSLGMRTKRKQR